MASLAHDDLGAGDQAIAPVRETEEVSTTSSRPLVVMTAAGLVAWAAVGYEVMSRLL